MTTLILVGSPAFGEVPAVGAGLPGPADLAAMCGAFRPVPLPDGRALCTHGPDPAPDGIDSGVPRPLAPEGQAEGLIFDDPPGDAPRRAAATPGIGCFGDGQDGTRVEAIYAFPADRPDRYGQVLPSIRQWAAETDAVFQASAAQTGGTRRIRFVTDGNCDLVVNRVALSSRGDDTLDTTIAELATQGYNRSNRKYLVWMDSTVLCGIATYYADDRPTADNFNNGRSGVPASVSRIDAGCWGLGSRGQSVEAHELMHSLGAVMPTAPNATVRGHCNDDDDRMCYSDGSPLLNLRSLCGSDQEALLDCRHDDYFSTAPPAGSYLATHWNGASSSFLSATFSSPTLALADGVTTEGDSASAPLSFTVTLSGPDSRPVSVAFATADGSAQAPGDYQATSGRLTFNPGETSKTITVAVTGDTQRETDETFSLSLSSPGNGLLGRAQAFGTIVDNEEAAGGQGYWFVAADGGIFAFGNAGFFGSTGSLRLRQPVVGMAATPSAKGYWLVAADGGIFAFGDAAFFGSTGNISLNQPIVGMAPTPSGKGYWFVARDGGVFSFGDAGFFGAPANPAQPIVGIATTPTGQGYWCIGRGGTVYAFGDAASHGSPPASARIAGLAPTRSGRGYWLADESGAVHPFGDGRDFGSTGNLAQPVVGLAATPKGGGYWLVARDGGIFSFGDAKFFGSTGNIRLNQPIVGMTAPSLL
ncbi:MAG TPA: Calx-beta domain-containing protein [Acidimicrobiia bacterium]|nr:Calx-beta domain-containing protein [Acidimicrobiia bacterium]